MKYGALQDVVIPPGQWKAAGPGIAPMCSRHAAGSPRRLASSGACCVHGSGLEAGGVKGTWGLWIGVTLVALNMLVLVQDLVAWRSAGAGPNGGFPVWPAVALALAAAYLLAAGITFDRRRRGGR